MKSTKQNFGSNNRIKQAGFTLVELMVGLVIGLLATLAIVQVMSAFEGQKRTTTGTADAQTNGNIALYNITKEIQSAGYGLMFSGKHSDKLSAIDCTSLDTSGAAATAAGMTGLKDLNPVTIVDGGAGSDSITIRAGDTSLAGLPSRIISAPVGKAITVASNLGCKNGDFVLVNNLGSCAMSKLHAATGLTGDIIVNLAGTESVPASADENAVLSCIGNWHINTYDVSGGNLRLKEGSSAARDAVADVVDLQAQYGVSADANSNKITNWVNATGTYVATMAVADRNKIKAIRVAVVSRNPLAEKEDVTANCNFNTSAGLSVSLSGADCKKYRYSVYETIIPLRNMIWSKDPA